MGTRPIRIFLILLTLMLAFASTAEAQWWRKIQSQQNRLGEGMFYMQGTVSNVLDTDYGARNGITEVSGTTFELGGDLIQDTDIDIVDYALSIGAGRFQIVADTNDLLGFGIKGTVFQYIEDGNFILNGNYEFSGQVLSGVQAQFGSASVIAALTENDTAYSVQVVDVNGSRAQANFQDGVVTLQAYGTGGLTNSNMDIDGDGYEFYANDSVYAFHRIKRRSSPTDSMLTLIRGGSGNPDTLAYVPAPSGSSGSSDPEPYKVADETDATWLLVSGAVAYIHPDGDNSTARLGIASRPFADAQTAIDSMELIITSPNWAAEVNYLGGDYTNDTMEFNSGSTVDLTVNFISPTTIDIDEEAYWISREGPSVYVQMNGSFEITGPSASALPLFDGCSININGDGPSLSKLITTTSNYTLGTPQGNSSLIQNCTIQNTGTSASSSCAQITQAHSQGPLLFKGCVIRNDGTGDGLQAGNAGRFWIDDCVIIAADVYAIDNVSSNDNGWQIKDSYLESSGDAVIRNLQSLTIRNSILYNTTTSTGYGIRLGAGTNTWGGGALGIYNSIISIPDGAASSAAYINTTNTTVTIMGTVSTHSGNDFGGGTSQGTGITVVATPPHFETWD